MMRRTAQSERSEDRWDPLSWISVRNSRFFVSVRRYIRGLFYAEVEHRHLWITHTNKTFNYTRDFLPSVSALGWINSTERVKPIIEIPQFYSPSFINNPTRFSYFIVQINYNSHSDIKPFVRSLLKDIRFAIKGRVQIPCWRNRCSASCARILYAYIYRPTNTCTHSCGHSYLAGSKWKHVFSLASKEDFFPRLSIAL